MTERRVTGTIALAHPLHNSKKPAVQVDVDNAIPRRSNFLCQSSRSLWTRIRPRVRGWPSGSRQIIVIAISRYTKTVVKDSGLYIQSSLLVTCWYQSIRSYVRDV
jgi:hypothetical protein